MNKNSLKKFALKAREKLKSGIEQKALKFGISKNGITKINVIDRGFVVNGEVFGDREQKKYEALVKKINEEGYNSVIEEATYTWFNRFIALRFMEVNNYLPINMRILSSSEKEKTEPDALTMAHTLIEELNLEADLVYKHQDEMNRNELYQYLLIHQCNQLGEILPTVFGEITEEIGLLLPDGLLGGQSVIGDILSLIEEEDWKDVEIVGWLYQFYVSEEKDEFFANRSKKAGKDDIGPATQLFTPKWIVKYMVDNSLGRYWLESHPDKTLKTELKYYLDNPEQTEEVKQQLDVLRDSGLDVEEIKFLDPSCGSGHILVYAFEVFQKMYLTRGYREREIPQKILKNNLYGLDIDKRAAQLATFAVVMKARENDRRLFKRDIQTNIYSIEESNSIVEEDIEYFADGDEDLFKETDCLVKTFKDAKLYGSIIRVNPIRIERIEEKMAYIQEKAEVNLTNYALKEYTFPILETLISQYKILADQFDIVVTNPPYMGSSGMDLLLKEYLKKNYPISKTDLFSVFLELCSNLTKKNGFFSNINQQSWMYLISFEKLRDYILRNLKIVSLLHLGTNVFEEISGEVVQSSAFVIKNIPSICSKPFIIDLYNKGDKSNLKDISNKKIFSYFKQKDFLNIPSSIINYKMDERTFQLFTNNKIINDIATVKRGPSVNSINKSVKNWYEVKSNKVGYSLKDSKWVFVSRDGSKVKWYNPTINVIDTSNIILNANNTFFNDEALTWPDARFGSPKISASIKHNNYAVESGVNVLKTSSERNYYNLLLFFNSYFYHDILSDIVNGQHFSPIYIKKLPYVNIKDDDIVVKVNEILFILKNIEKFYEIYQNFEQPFTITNMFINDIDNHITYIKSSYTIINNLESELNQIIERETGITKRKQVYNESYFFEIPAHKDLIKRFLSFLVGIMFGRYSLDGPGLILAGGEWDEARYSSYKPDKTNIIPVTEESYFEDDIMKKVEELLSIIYGESSLEENLRYIAQALVTRRNESARERIRRYFQKDFFKDHKQIYKKRPIYWMFSSGRRGAFKGLMYLHRYDKYTIARLRTEYVLKEIQGLETLTTFEESTIQNELSSKKEKATAQKRIENYQKDKKEISEFAEILEHVAKQELVLDLDDGVKVNYAKFQGIERVNPETGKIVKKNILEKL